MRCAGGPLSGQQISRTPSRGAALTVDRIPVVGPAWRDQPPANFLQPSGLRFNDRRINPAPFALGLIPDSGKKLHSSGKERRRIPCFSSEGRSLPSVPARFSFSRQRPDSAMPRPEDQGCQSNQIPHPTGYGIGSQPSITSLWSLRLCWLRR